MLDNHLYALAWSCNNWKPAGYCDEDVAYSPYECDLDYKSCDPLPIRYIDYVDDYYLELRANEQSGEITLFDSYDETLIFTYGEHPRCYVEGCGILK